MAIIDYFDRGRLINAHGYAFVMEGQRWSYDESYGVTCQIAHALIDDGARRGAAHAPGRIVNIGSVAGAFATPFMVAYAGSKHALEAISQGLRRELKLYGIEVATIEPSFIRSRLFEKTVAGKPLEAYADSDFAAAWRQFSQSLLNEEKRAQSPEVVTRAVIHAIEAPKPRTRYPMHSIWYIGRWLPDRGFDWLIFKALGIDKLMRAKAAT